jgi:hypothetical protein
LAQSPDVARADTVMPGCRDALNPDAVNKSPYRIYLKATCTGIIRTMFYFGHANLGMCPPTGSNIGQAIRVVILYIDQRPARMHEQFEDLALEALQQAWPCR